MVVAMDPYSLCPCGSGKKLKFCCADLIGEIEKIHRMIEGDQPRAALRHVEQTLAEQPGRASLLDLKATLQLSLGEVEAARETIDQFIQCDPQSSAAHAHNAIALAEQGQHRDAIEALQNGLDLVETNLPQRAVEAIGAVGYLLLKKGDVVAARAHLWLYESIMGEHDGRAIELLVRMNQVSGLPLVLRDQLSLRSLPEGHRVAGEMAAIQRLAAAGKWRSAAAACDDLLPDHLDEPLFFYNRALLSGYLADQKNFVAGMRLYARQEIPLDDAIEAEAIAQVVDSESQDPPVESVRIAFDVVDGDALVDRLAKDEKVANYPVPPDEFKASDGPMPRAVYLLLDQPMPKADDLLTRENIPRILGVLAHYGRQTDRDERIEIVVDRDAKFHSTLDTMTQVLGESLGQKMAEEPAGYSQNGDPVLSWAWHFPESTPPAQRRALLAEERRDAFLNRWPEKPRKALAGKSPREAANDPDLRLPLLASLLLLEQGASNASYGETLAQLREQLGLPASEPIDPDTIDTRSVSIARISRVDLSKLPDSDLALLYKRAVLVNATGALQPIVREGLLRPAFASEVPVEKLYEQLFSLQEDNIDALRVLDEARTWAKANDQSCGYWDLLELQLHLADGDPEGAQRMLSHLKDNHMNEPKIAEQVYQLLHMIGAIPPEAEQGPAPPSPIPAGATADGGIWTPDGESSSEGKSKLWTPD